MTKRESLHKKLLFWTQEIIFDDVLGGPQLLLEIDAFNGHINWLVKEGDHYTDFVDFNDACEYYLEAIGEK